MKIWLDDERDPDQVVIQNKFGSESGMFWVKTAWSAISRLKDGNVTFISFDHDLGPASAGTGYDVAKWIEENADSLNPISWACHSMNPIGKKNIEAAMKSAERRWKNE